MRPNPSALGTLVLVASASVIALLGALPGAARADCVCRPTTPAAAAAEATLILEGRVESIDLPRQMDRSPVRARVRALRVWKGEVHETMTLQIPSPVDECASVVYEVGGAYLLYARVTTVAGLPPVVYPCGRSAPLAEAGEDLTWLRAAGVPSAPRAASATSGSAPTPDAGAASGGGAAPAPSPAGPPAAPAAAAPPARASTPGPAPQTAPGAGGCASCAVARGAGASALLAPAIVGLGALGFRRRRARPS